MAGDRDIAYCSATELLDALSRRGAVAGRGDRRRCSPGSTRCSPRSMRSASSIATARWRRRAQSEQRWLRGEPIGPLDGVPVDDQGPVLMRGLPTLRGSRLVEPDQDWTEDAPAVARLREAGAVILGKTTTPEFGWKASATARSPASPATRGTSRARPGGSSAGAAAALRRRHRRRCMSAPTAPARSASRAPSPASSASSRRFGRVPAYPPSPMGLVAHVGPMARTVARCGADAERARRGPTTAIPMPCRPRHATISTASRTACAAGGSPTARRSATPKVDPEIAAAVAAAARRFEELGAMVETGRRGFAVAARGAADLVGGGRGAAPRRLPGGRARASLDPGLLEIGAERRAAQRRRLSRRRSRAHRARRARWRRSTAATICC